MFATKTRRSLCIPVDILIDIDSKHVVLNQSNRLFGMPSSHQTNDLGLLGISPYLQMISQRTKNLRANMEKLGVDVDSIWDKSQIYCYKPLFIDDFPIKNLYIWYILAIFTSSSRSRQPRLPRRSLGSRKAWGSQRRYFLATDTSSRISSNVENLGD